MNESYAVIPLTKGKVAIVDVTSLPILEHKSWYSNYRGAAWYAFTDHKGIPLAMHRILLGLQKGDKVFVDHKNKDGLDNRKCNLRTCTNQQNQQNAKRRKDAPTRYRGITYAKKSLGSKKLWYAQIRINGKRISLGSHKTQRDAAIAYDLAAIRYHGEFARTNVIGNVPTSD
jgi:hypothetical protein